ncbi:Derlin 1 [Borealophlyctis nickersoniae]|nr:Derlin 1 [Borealophlyctis nickersoniae]
MPSQGPLAEITDFFKAIPPITRFLFSALFFTSVAAQIGIVSPWQLLLIPDFVYRKFQLWRLVTCYLWNPLGFAFLMNLYFIYTQSRDLETGLFAGRKADYVFFLLFSMLLADVRIGFGIVPLWAAHEDRNGIFYLALPYR